MNECMSVTFGSILDMPIKVHTRFAVHALVCEIEKEGKKEMDKPTSWRRSRETRIRRICPIGNAFCIMFEDGKIIFLFFFSQVNCKQTSRYLHKIAQLESLYHTYVYSAPTVVVTAAVVKTYTYIYMYVYVYIYMRSSSFCVYI